MGDATTTTTTAGATTGGIVLVALIKSARRGAVHAWSFDREVVPSSLQGGDGTSGNGNGVVVLPIGLWRTTCDRVVALHESQQTRCTTIFQRRRWARLFQMLPLCIFLGIFVDSLNRRFYGSAAQNDDDDENNSRFLWQAWLVTVVTLPVFALVPWLMTRCYIQPALLGLEHEWEGLAQDLQEEYRRYGVQVRVKRVPAVLRFLVALMPNGLTACGLVLERPALLDNDGRARLPEQVEDLPPALVVTGVPLGTWASTVGQCTELHEDQTARIKAAAQSVQRFTDTLSYLDAACFVTAPFIAWACGWTSDYQTSNMAMVVCFFVIAGGLLGFLLLRNGSRIRTVWNQCDDEWRALSERTEPIWAQYHVTVAVQCRDIPLLRGNRDLKEAVTFAFGSTERAVGLSFRTADGAVVSIEYGKVEMGDDEAQQQQHRLGNTEKDIAVLNASFV